MPPINQPMPLGRLPPGGNYLPQPGGNVALQDYQMQLMLLEQHNKKRLLMARKEQDTMAQPPFGAEQEDIVPDPDATPEQAAFRSELERGSMKSELKYLDRKLTMMGQPYYAEMDEHQPEPDKVNWWSQFALCLVRRMVDHHNRDVESVSLQVNSPHLKSLLEAEIVGYPGVSFATADVSIEKPYHCLFHYRRQLQAAGRCLPEGSEAKRHHGLLMQFIQDEFKDTIREADNLLSQGLISFDLLWTIFRPGDIVCSTGEGQPRAFKLKACLLGVTARDIEAEYVDFDGYRMGLLSERFSIPSYSGTKKITSLQVYPIDWNVHSAELWQSLETRGRRWEALAGVHFMRHSGVATQLLQPKTSFAYDGKVVVDMKTSSRFNFDSTLAVRPLRRQRSRSKQPAGDDFDDEDEDEDVDEESPEYRGYVTAEPLESLDDILASGRQRQRQTNEALALRPLTPEECLIASPRVRGFAFGEKRWLDFYVDNLSRISWNADCFEQLVLPTQQKSLIKALVSTHVDGAVEVDDIVADKGKGLIFVLHGPPGTGKTLTAETVAEFAQRPLYSVSSAELGTDSSALDFRLAQILDMAQTWQCVLLIDEADVFLEARSPNDLHRNALVSIFLRVLEYFGGILFLTSNRIAVFDEAFKSRIHVPLKYKDLSPAARRLIWKNFFERASKGDCSVAVAEGGKKSVGSVAAVDGKALDRLASANINGRQIKNVIRTAKSLALYHKQPLDEKLLLQVIGLHEEFEEDIEDHSVVRIVSQKAE